MEIRDSEVDKKVDGTNLGPGESEPLSFTKELRLEEFLADDESARDTTHMHGMKPRVSHPSSLTVCGNTR